MEVFNKSKAVKLRSHLDKYLCADDDQKTVRQRRNGSSRRAAWFVEFVEGKSHAIRLRSYHGTYLTAADEGFLLGMTGQRVIQKVPEKGHFWKCEWVPIKDGFQVKLRSWSGKYLRANGGTPPWRNSVTHDDPHTTSTQNWTLWDVQAVEVDSITEFMLYLSSSSSLSDEVLGSEPESPMSVISTTSPTPFYSNQSEYSNIFRSGMDLFQNAKAVRLRSHHDKYLLAEEDEESVIQDRYGSSKTARWTVEFVPDSHHIIRLKSCYNRYLTASNQPFLLGMTGRKVVQSLPRRPDSSVEWEPIREGNQVKLRTRYGNFLRANGGLPPWRNSVTHDIPHRTSTQDWILWDVDIIEILVQSPSFKSQPPLPLPPSDSLHFDDSSSPSSVSIKSGKFSRQESTDSNVSSPPKSEGRTIYYQVAADNGDVDDETVEGYSFTFKGNGVDELTHKFVEETGLEGIILCHRNPLNGKLYPLRLQLPPNNTTMNVIVVLSSSKGEFYLDLVGCFLNSKTIL
ncbi:hypothetical protein I3842_06G080500 [Carya illinoinensis]|uniref:Actin cross-linking n=2 Tax=Carya illinoinensis TaxID=32201 RepID=A0A922ERX6_CARIL|nr:hypothetical protein I3842_06G080500 [Carya illinoinensis]